MSPDANGNFKGMVVPALPASMHKPKPKGQVPRIGGYVCIGGGIVLKVKGLEPEHVVVGKDDEAIRIPYRHCLPCEAPKS